MAHDYPDALPARLTASRRIGLQWPESLRESSKKIQKQLRAKVRNGESSFNYLVAALVAAEHESGSQIHDGLLTWRNKMQADGEYPFSHAVSMMWPDVVIEKLVTIQQEFYEYDGSPASRSELTGYVMSAGLQMSVEGLTRVVSWYHYASPADVATGMPQ